MQKWEYCLLRSTGKREYWVLFPNGKKAKYSDDYMKILNFLGDQGWEAVNFQVSDKQLNSLLSYKGWPAGSITETLLKREKTG